MAGDGTGRSGRPASGAQGEPPGPPMQVAVAGALLTALVVAAVHLLGPLPGWQRAALAAAFSALGVVLTVRVAQAAVVARHRLLSAGEEAWRSLVHNIDGCVWRVDLTGCVTYVSPSVAQLSGYQPDEVVGRPLSDFLSGESAALALGAFGDRLAGKLPAATISYELVHCRRDGSEFQAEVRCTPIYGAGGKLVAVQGITHDVTEQRRAELALAEAEARFTRILEASPMGMYLYELLPDNRLVFRVANGAADRLLGVDHAQFLGLTIEEAFPPLADTEVPARYRAIARDGESWSTEQLIYDDQQIHGAFEVHAFQPQPRFVAVMFLDVTSRRRDAAAVEESEARFRFLFDEMAQGVVYQDAEGRVIQANASACRILGLTMDQMLGRSSRDPRWRTVREDGTDLPGEEHPAMIALRTGREVRDSLFGVYNPVDGAHRWIMVSAVPQFRAGADQPYQCFATFTDVTDLRAANQALRDSEGLVREAQEAARVGSYLVDWQADTWTVSPMLETIFGVPPGYARAGGRWRDLLHPDDRADILAYLAEVTATGDRFDHIYRVVCPTDGEVRWVHQLGEVERDADGTALRLRGTTRDVSEAKSAELAQARLEEQLRRAQRLESLGVLAGGIAHDFNNILAGILGYTELTQPLVAADSEASDNLANVLSGVHRARELVRQILAFSRQATLSPAPTRLEHLVGEAQRMLRAALGANIELRVELEADTPPALVDPARIHQVLLNLCTNAAQAMPGGGVLTVGLSPAQVDQGSSQVLAGLAPGRYVVLSVADTGCGMDAATLDRIFDPFFTTKAPGEGTGLGLSTSHGIVTGHGGAITVYSEPGHGSTFRVWLPATDAEPTAMVRPEPAPPVPGAGRRVLFVDDEPALVGVATALLRVMGYEARLTRDPVEALAWLRESPDAFDVLVTDQTMPHLLGLDLAREAHALRPDLPIIIASGFSARISPDEAAEAGVAAVLAKPYGHRELGLALARVLGG